MKICFIGPGEISIPPKGWGAVETVIWNQYSELLRLGYDVHIVNEATAQETYNAIKKLNPALITEIIIIVTKSFCFIAAFRLF